MPRGMRSSPGFRPMSRSRRHRGMPPRPGSGDARDKSLAGVSALRGHAGSPDSLPRVNGRGALKRFGALTAVEDVTFEIRAGGFFGLLGTTGAGKPTMIRIRRTLLSPTSKE